MQASTIRLDEPLLASLLSFLEASETHPTVRLLALKKATLLAERCWSVDDPRLNDLLKIQKTAEPPGAPRSTECSSGFEETVS